MWLPELLTCLCDQSADRQGKKNPSRLRFTSSPFKFLRPRSFLLLITVGGRQRNFPLAGGGTSSDLAHGAVYKHILFFFVVVEGVRSVSGDSGFHRHQQRPSSRSGTDWGRMTHSFRFLSFLTAVTTHRHTSARELPSG